MRYMLRLLVALLFAAFLLPSARALASSGEEVTAEMAGLTELEHRALHADAREQCFLYTQLAKGYSEVASRQIAAGEMERAVLSLKQVEHAASMVHGALNLNAKRLKDAEMMLHAASFRLGEVLRYVSNEDKIALQSTLRNLNKVNEEILAQVFSH